MIDWMARARAELGKPRGGCTAETDESRVVSVSSVARVPASAVVDSPSSVSSAPRGTSSATGHFGINTHMTLPQLNDCHLGGWDDAEIATFMARIARFTRMGRPDAEHLAERLTLRDREVDDRRMCLECAWLGDTGRCLAAATGRISGANRRLEPVATILQRCDGFGLRKGLV